MIRTHRPTVHCGELTTGEYHISGCSNQGLPGNDPAAVAFQRRALAELGARLPPAGGMFGAVVARERLAEARALCREVFGLDWEESTRLDQQSILGMFGVKP